jgi:uncharacterized protein YbbC (DUF1343 family)
MFSMTRVLLATLMFSVAAGVSTAAAQVKVGLDVLKEQEFKPLEGKRVAIVTNHSGIDKDGNHLVKLLHEAEDVNLVKIFSPEHGLYGTADHAVDDMTDPVTGLPVYSLYGETRRPSDEMMQGIDTIVFDIQDAGVRFYTYSATLGYIMEAAAKHDIEVVVLDRPNPITGEYVAGPIADEKRFGFTAYGPMPLVHGMTLGELAKLYKGEWGVDVELTVVPMEGWTRDMWWEDTGVKWVNPSPNLRSPKQTLLYPALGLLESGTNTNVGRGTETPFEWFGAPFIDPDLLAKTLNDMNLPGLEFEPVTYTPTNTHHAYNDTEVHGVKLNVTDKEKVDSVLTGAVIAWTLEELFPEENNYDTFENMLQNKEAFDAIAELDDPRKANEIWADDVEEFKKLREPYLMYE